MQKGKAAASPPAMVYQGRAPQQYPWYNIIQDLWETRQYSQNVTQVWSQYVVG